MYDTCDPVPEIMWPECEANQWSPSNAKVEVSWGLPLFPLIRPHYVKIYTGTALPYYYIFSHNYHHGCCYSFIDIIWLVLVTACVNLKIILNLVRTLNALWTFCEAAWGKGHIFVNFILIWNYVEIIIILSLQNQIIKSDFTDILKVFKILKAGNNILYSVN